LALPNRVGVAHGAGMTDLAARSQAGVAELHRRHPKTRMGRVLIGLELFLAVAGIVGGVMMIVDPSGGLIGMSLEVFADTPFHDLLVPGIALLTINGLWPLAVAVEALRHGRWAALGHVLVGLTVLGWMAVQFLIMGYQLPVQIIITVYGAIVLALASLNWRSSRPTPS
jgi:hypothetical protein